MSLAQAYNIQKRSKMAKGGMACAHGGAAYCNKGCYADGGEVKSAPEASHKAIGYEEMTDEKEDEMPNMPPHLMKESMNAMDAEEDGNMVSEDSPMKMVKGGMMGGKKMAKMIMMASGGMVKNSEAALKEGDAETMAQEDHSGGDMDNEDIDMMWTTPHDDNLSDEGEYPLMEEEGYEEGRQSKERRKGGILERVMAKIHSR